MVCLKTGSLIRHLRHKRAAQTCVLVIHGLKITSNRNLLVGGTELDSIRKQVIQNALIYLEVRA
jgi:hypothetical protein